jgi:uncharacterized membrane protein
LCLGLRRLAIIANVDYPGAVLEMAEIQAAAGTPFARETGFAHFDGIFLIGIGAALIASLSQSWSRR